MPSLILASESPRRAELLRQLGYEFKVVPSGTPEIHHGDLTAQEIAQINAYRKARTVSKKYQDALVIGADTLVFMDRILFGKPKSLEKGLAKCSNSRRAKRIQWSRRLSAAPPQSQAANLRREYAVS
jgi:septum formation protein